MLIGTGRLGSDALAGEVVVVTGGGGGIGFEAARALLWLGASVVVAEIDERSGAAAAAALAGEWPAARVAFVATDVADETSVRRLMSAAEASFGRVDAVLNNATVASVGHTVWDGSVETWDRSYGVNLRGPVLLARAFLPGMIARGHGVFACVSSTGGPFLASYEVMKAAQVDLANTLDQELDGTGVVAFTIGPGLVPTPTAAHAVEVLAPRLGMSVPEFYEMNRGALLSVEAAGAGFAAAIALAGRYGGQEISSTQALVDAGIDVPDEPALPPGVELPSKPAGSAEPSNAVSARPSSERGAPSEPASEVASEPASGPASEPALAPAESALELCGKVRATLAGQAAGWRERSFFERQWMQRDFKQRAGMPVERWLEALDRLASRLAAGTALGAQERPPLERLAAFYGHLGDLARGYVKEPAERDAQLATVATWRSEVERLARACEPAGESRPNG